MYPLRSKIIKNTFFLGEQLPSAAELMDTDPGVSALRSQINSAKMNLENLLSNQGVATYAGNAGGDTGKRLRGTTVRWNAKDLSKFDSSGVTWHMGNRYMSVQAGNLKKQITQAQQQLIETEKRLAEAEKRVWDHISKAVPYKAYIIKPIVDRGANTIVYQLTKGGVNIGEPHQQLDEAKAVVDNEIAAEQSKQVQQWTEERGAAEGVLPKTGGSLPVPAVQKSSEAGPVVQKTTATLPPGGVVTVTPQEAPSNTGKYLLVGGAALAAVLLMK